jgi:hypothetical protein
MRATRVAAAAGVACCAAASPSAAAGPAISLAARPDTVVAFAGVSDVMLFGILQSRQANQEIAFEAKECGTSGSFHLVGSATTGSGGAFSGAAPSLIGVTTRFRARWRSDYSDAVTVHARPRVDLHHSGLIYGVDVFGRGYLRGKRVTLERFGRGRWTAVRTMTLRTTFATGGSVSARIRLPGGVLVRAVLPRSQARPCFLPGVSNTVRA